MNKWDIEKDARSLQLAIWDRRHLLWPNENRRPHEILEPDAAGHLLGVHFEYREELGRFGYRGSRFEIAGLLDRPRCLIALALKFSPEVVRFTAAHEVGHWRLHPGEILHRDRPIGGLTGANAARPPVEKEADYFAACFLMPKKLVAKAIQGTFRRPIPLVIDDSFAFHLCPSDPDSVLRADMGSLTRELAVAAANSFNGRHFNSLAQQFRVSTTTMAIRLRELELIRE